MVGRKGLVQGVLAYALWGIVPVYWKLLVGVDPLELIAHRALWGLGAFAILVAASGKIDALRAALRKPRVIGVMALTGGLLAVNWGTFVWATMSGRLIDASLGYFISPLVSIALGMLVLRERLRRLQWVAIAFATVGACILTWQAGHVPWVALVLAFTFSLYGLVRKTAKVDAVVGSAIETALMAPIAAVYLVAVAGHGALGHADAATHLLLVGTGVVTAVPFVLFVSAARQLPLSTIGFIQYVSPTLQFLLAVIAFHEPLAHDKLVAFALIWVSLVVFSVDLWRARPR